MMNFGVRALCILRRKMKNATALVGIAVTVSGCATISGNLSKYNELPMVASVTESNKRLREIPPPSQRVSVAVYNFQDLTGQYKEAKLYQQLSRAVTQGGAPILIKALQDAGQRQWFTVLERSQLANLLKERQIITEMRRLYRGEENINANVLPPLKHAAIIIEGGIVGYNTNLSNGGIGARLLGIGADMKFSRDEITVSLRAVSTKTGEVLASVTARKTVMSVLLQSGVFRYIKLDELLEAEAGIASNEPRQIAVEGAVEKAVEALIIEGTTLGIWKFENPAAGASYVEKYQSEIYRNLMLAGNSAPARPETRSPARIAATVPVAWRTPVPAEISQTTRQLPPPQGSDEQPAG